MIALLVTRSLVPPPVDIQFATPDDAIEIVPTILPFMVIEALVAAALLTNAKLEDVPITELTAEIELEFTVTFPIPPSFEMK